MEAYERLFISLSLPEPCREELIKLQDRRPGIAWTPPDQIHLTMRFVGEVDADLSGRIEESLAKVAVEPFVLPLERVGRFPPRGPYRVLWAGVGNGHTRLFQLRQRIDDALLAAGWRGDLRGFDPHITLGRVKEAERVEVERWLEKHDSFEGPPFRVQSFDLMQSELQSTGAVHALKRRFSLGG